MPSYIESVAAEGTFISSRHTHETGTEMKDGNFHTYKEHYNGNLLEWTNRVDAVGSRIEWQIVTDNEGWVSSYGPVCNQGIHFGSKAISSPAEEKALLSQLRLLAGQRAANANSALQSRAA
jgi:hypothetical protein